MSWIVEQSDNTSAVHVNGNTITCTKDGYYDSPINIMYNDPADHNGQYFWELKFIESATEGGSSAVGNLSDGSGLLVQSFGNQIKQGDKVHILLELTDSDMKMYLFHNERSLGLAFHVQSPYPKPLYPVVSFSGNGKVTITRSDQKHGSLERASSQYNSVEGKWKVLDFPQHPECIGCEFKVQRHEHIENMYVLFANVVNMLHCNLEHNPTTNEWKSADVMSTLMAGPSELMKEEQVISNFLSEIQNVHVEDQQILIMRSKNGVEIKLERCTEWAPSPVTENIFT
ncbi:unnamed protein product [Rotaria sp. Silwood1]|nr:unnamed protein product [Rotaria sp. Silwood1]CAF4716040.1 unnamed protein product [Rotaria sp. Silwood1]